MSVRPCLRWRGHLEHGLVEDLAMRRIGLMVTGLLVLHGLTSPLSAQQPPSFAKDVRPFLAKYCIECHNPDKAKGELDLQTFKAMMQGGKKGAAVVAGKPDDSSLVTRVEHKTKPVMPPAKALQPKPEEIGVLRAWVAAGAKDDSASIKITLPSIKSRTAAPPPVAALAYRPDGKLLAAGIYQEVVLLDPSNGTELGRLAGQAETVTALAFSPDGQRLAIASGASGAAGELRIYAFQNGQVVPKPEYTIAAHADIIYSIAFSPDGKTLATTGYDRLIKLWDVASGKALRPLKDHSDTVYGLAFSGDGKLLASAAADRAVKIWDVATGRRLYSLGDATDWLYALAWSPDGKQVAAAGVDKSIRVWEVSAEEGKLLHSVFAHERPVLRLVYSQDGKTLYSLAEDRVLKSWDASRLTEKRTYDKQPEAVLSLAVRPDNKQLALGRYDGALVLLDAETGKPQAQPLPAKPQPPKLNKLTPDSGQRGKAVRVLLEGQNLDGVEVLSASKEARIAIVPEGRTRTTLAIDLTLPPDTPAGNYPLSVKGPGGQSSALPFFVDLFPMVVEQEPNDAPTSGQKIALPASIAGSLNKAGDVDFFRFEARAGQEIGVQALAGDLAKLDAVLQLTDGSGQVLAESSSGLLGYRFDKAGTYALGIRDRDYRGGGLTYRLHVGDIPIVTAVFPLGLQRGTEAEVRFEGVHLGATRTLKVKAPADAAPGTRLPLHVAALGNPGVLVGEFPEVSDPASVLVVPGTANGVIAQPGQTQPWRFPARKGQRLIVEVNARRIGTPLDSSIEILDAQGKPVPRAVLRCLAKTYTTFRDHDSASPGIRLETWNELAVNDSVWVGNELLRIRVLPKNPDDDCQFFAVNGQRVGYLDTTPTHHPMNTPVYKVAIHPPGTTFPPNGLPVIPVYYRNDDGGAGYGKDSRLFFDPPADGNYQVRVADARGQGGTAYGYRLTVRPPRPSFQVRFNPTAPAVWKGGAVPITVTAERGDGFEGAIDVKLENLPPGFSAPPTSIPAGEMSTAFALYAEAGPTVPAGQPPLKLVARATIDNQTVVREVTGGVPTTADPGDIVASVEQSEIVVQPGKEGRLTVKIERKNGFTGRVPVEVRGLPHGVRVLDIGLNGILITERDTSRTMAIYCEPWVQPTEHPFVVLAIREGKRTEHAAKSVLLKVTK
jgi:WD40 repeat protein